MTTFGARLRAAVQARGPLCAGIDPHPELLRDWGLADDAVGLGRFARAAVAGLAPEVAVVKPQSAFFERHGSRGVAVLEQLITEARAAGALVLLDAKRGDIGSTSQAYADAYLDPASPLAVDAITVSPYLGFASLRPIIDTARAHDAGVFVLAFTSNPEGPQVQRAVTASGRSVGAEVLEELRRANGDERPWGSLGAVVGATIGDSGGRLDINGPLLAPGLGAQGGTVADLRRVFGAAAGDVLPSSSRGLLRQGPEVAALRDAARRTNAGLVDLGER